ncbi:hypothetical protein BDN70DRAFT_688057 [Pholiota conissans]|uniref:Uncharacterized protein n=1 Tax=Pholiota conissans TaxID=109636 RepID=A0A9P5Z292_9AGAR|nr:hypothetical protein BDN70DRAFT_688057 [Pholiota conissans]
MSITPLQSLCRCQLTTPSTAQSSPRWPTDKVAGGFTFNNATCVAWASRIHQVTLNPEVLNDYTKAFSIVMYKVEHEPFNEHFEMLGRTRYQEYMIITRMKPFKGWEGMDSTLIPQFKEGRREAFIRTLLEAEGVTDYEFKTIVYTSDQQETENAERAFQEQSLEFLRTE